jgi:hypothetical protein
MRLCAETGIVAAVRKQDDALTLLCSVPSNAAESPIEEGAHGRIQESLETPIEILGRERDRDGARFDTLQPEVLLQQGLAASEGPIRKPPAVGSVESRWSDEKKPPCQQA